ncbi:hypothetical protein GPECTOR_3g392 [Gonium pectorale]|uniref:Uncharacterized protein n=1 Tax=Gonium pectorale TaxID=33097 RepID=A0A150GZS5_GONPE|nr:hypothetical protein GPECTOR_3g392 [Gonium pectorale]|eukprot:KXZ55253.1 hypothetical protein GPECTOR_3g392 [Gonium pectorale]
MGMALRMSQRLGPGGSGGGGALHGGALSGDIDARPPFGLVSRNGVGAYSAGLGPSAAAAFGRPPGTGGSSPSSRRRSSSSYTSDASWTPGGGPGPGPGTGRFESMGRAGAAGGGDAAGAGHMLPLLWPGGSAAGGGGDEGRTSTGGASAVGGGLGGGHAAVGAGGRWRIVPAELSHTHGLQGGGSGGGGGVSHVGRWRPPPLNSSLDSLGSPLGGGPAASPHADAAGEPSWEHRYGGLAASAAHSGLGLVQGGPTGGGGGGAGGGATGLGRHSPRSGLLGSSGMSLLARTSSINMPLGERAVPPGGGLRPSMSGGLGSSLGPAGRRDSLSMGRRESGVGGDSILGAGGGPTLRIVIDGPGGSYERHRMLLATGSRGPQPLDSPSAASAAGSVGGGGASIVGRQFGDGLAGVLTNSQIQEWMSQHASRLLLPRHMQEIADIVFRPPSAVTDKSCRASDPNNALVQAVVTALQGKEVVVAEEEDDEPAPRSVPVAGS